MRKMYIFIKKKNEWESSQWQKWEQLEQQDRVVLYNNDWIN